MFVEKVVAEQVELIKQDFTAQVQAVVIKEMAHHGIHDGTIAKIEEDAGSKDAADYFSYLVSAGVVSFLGIDKYRNRDKQPPST